MDEAPVKTMNDVKYVEIMDMAQGVGLRHFAPAAISATGPAGDAAYDLRLTVARAEAGALVASATVVNTGDVPLLLAGFRWRFDPRQAGGPALYFPAALNPHVFATQNLRSEYFFTGTVEGDRYAYPLTNQQVEYGQSEDHVFPGVFVAAAAQPVGLFMAQASQRRLHAIFRFRGRMEGREQWLFEIEERPGGIDALPLAPGESLRGEDLFFQVVGSNDPQRATGAYYRHLRAAGAFARRLENPLPGQRIYCTWNYDFMADIDEEKLLGQIPILKRHFPTVKFLQLDDGYQRCHAPGRRAMIDLCYGDLDTPFDPVRFPSGPGVLADRIKADGLRPAIWLGLWASTGSRMLVDHPDWVLRDDTGEPLIFDKWYGGTAVLDPSIAGVRDYLDRLCATVFGEWGFEGVKLDFSSFAFNGRRFRFREPGKTAVELRHELESIFRRHLPRDGFFGWCVVAGTAQPFLAQADYFRNAIDIGHGNWALARRIAMWTANTRMFLQEAPCLPNIDSIGWNKAFDETAWITWLNFCAISGGAVEVSGDLRKLPVERLRRLAWALELSDPDRLVRCPGLGTLHGQPPMAWIAEGRGATLAGLFNWTTEEIEAPLRDVLPDLIGAGVVDAWDGTAMRLPETLKLMPRDSRLWRLT